MALKVKDLQSLKRKDPKLYEIIVAAENAAKSTDDQTPAERSGASDTPAQPKKDLNYRPSLPKRSERTKRRRRNARRRNSANPRSERVWVEEPNVVAPILALIRWGIAIGGVILMIQPMKSPTYTDGYVSLAVFALLVFLVTFGIGYLVAAIVVGPLEKILPHGRGRWVKTKRK